ncbi:transmembrane channel-like protein 7 isoform X2 [Plodia interpunctella]|uniref:transmembrane channel-like protein 7 isoform X2 n=1 Tax=Plodia interpunctella TaxID=58824 RepID=UPI00236850F2|nr:transmembrane channel-like protein 7 isoform X2 [Plodia interpunctella]
MRGDSLPTRGPRKAGIYTFPCCPISLNATKLRLQGFEQIHWRQRKFWHRFRTRFGEIIGKLELWQSPMREIEGNFGTGVVSYFLFLRWLLFLNITISILVTLFLILPKVLLVENYHDCDEFLPNSTICCSQAYLERNMTDNNFVLDVIQGTGRMEKTILFYGVYTDQIYTYSLSNVIDAEMFYNMPLAYVLVPISWALLSLVAIVRTGAKGFKEKLVENEGQFYVYCNLVFGGWDFCIHNEKSARIKHRALFNEVKGLLEEDRFKEEKQMRSRESQILLHLKRIFINLVVLVILLLAGALIFITFNYSMHKLNPNATVSFSDKQSNYTASRLTFSRLKIDNNVDSNHESFIEQLENTLLEFLPFLCIVVLNVIVPEIFGYMVQFESYNPAHVLLITLLRTVLLRLSSLAVLLSQMYLYVTINGVKCTLANDDPSTPDCWETYVGQQFYKLILTDFAVQSIFTFVINLPRALIARHTHSKCLKIICEQDFYLPKHVLDIVYIQTLIWMGSFFCPLLPIIGAMFYFLIFYIKKFTCLVNCTPSPVVVYKASKSKSLFMSVLLLGFVISIAPVAYSVAEILPSVNCGPYRGYMSVWSYVVQTFDGFPYVIREISFQLGTSTFAIPAFAVLLFLLYYYWAVATANRHMVGVLKNQLVLEGHDKQFLLNRLSAFIRQHQKRCDRRNRASFADDDSSIRQSSR